MEFRGRPVLMLGAYPSVSWPEHPVAYKSGRAYIHRIVAYEKYGELPQGHRKQVHHIDGNVWNWNADNLELVSAEKHVHLHLPQERKPNSITRNCGFCGRPLEVRTARRKKKKKVFCNLACSNASRHRISWPPIEELIAMLKYTSFLEAGKLLGVSDNAIRKHLRRNGVDPKTLCPIV